MNSEGIEMVAARPFIKWAGGKSHLLKELVKSLPKINSYHEPFLGGGALFFHLSNSNMFDQAYLYDYNVELINAYEVVKNEPITLMEELSSGFYKNEIETYYKIRSLIPSDRVKRAARLIYLNKTAYNGLYRVNSNGGFNVPFGKYSSLKLFSRALIMADSIALQKAKLFAGDFEEVLRYARRDDLVYFDPPYQPISKTARFTKYTKVDFSEADQVRLAKVFRDLDRKGCHVLLSNSNSELVEQLYSDYYIEEVLAARAINCIPSKRGKIKEFVVRNWPVAEKQRILIAEQA